MLFCVEAAINQTNPELWTRLQLIIRLTGKFVIEHDHSRSSTGGLSNKQFGRVGDSPIIGAGTYADNKTCAVSCTGHGEQFIRNAVAYDVSAQMRYRNYTAKQAIDDVLANRLNPGAGGIIAVDKDGNIAMEFSTGGMARAAADSSGRFDVIWGENQKQEK